MIDAATPKRGKVKGSWSQNGAEVTIRFGDCLYRGSLQGTTLTGTAHFLNNPSQTWIFQVQQK